MDVAKFKELPIMGILRGVQFKALCPLVETVIRSELKTLEITMNTQDAPRLIKEAVNLSKGKLMVGAGTVLNMESLKKALDSGASFIVMPVLIRDVLEYCVKNKIPAFPGALTVQEIHNAWSQGATMVKVFPAKFFGPEYFREIKGPFNDLQLLACSGVTPENLAAYFTCGASAISFGGSVFKPEWLERGDFNSIGQKIKEYLRAFSQVRSKT